MLKSLIIACFFDVTVGKDGTCETGLDSACLSANLEEPLLEDDVSMIQSSMQIRAAHVATHQRKQAEVFGSALSDKECTPQSKSKSDDPHTKRILIATPLKNAVRHLMPFTASLARLSYPKSLLSLAFLVSDSDDGTAAVAADLATKYLSDFNDVSISIQNFGYNSPKDRHAFEIQPERRSFLAKSRNALLKHSLTQDIDYVLWMDADIAGPPATLVQDLLEVGLPIVAPHVVTGGSNLTYDRNSWRRSTDAGPPEADMDADARVAFFEAYSGKEEQGLRIHMDDLRDLAQRRGVNDWRYAVKLDGVGTGVLLVDAGLHRDMGLLFPETPYKHRLESEGFGLLAQDKGFPACGLPLYPVHHVNMGESSTLSQLMVKTLARARGAHGDTSFTRVSPVSDAWLDAVIDSHLEGLPSNESSPEPEWQNHSNESAPEPEWLRRLINEALEDGSLEDHMSEKGEWAASQDMRSGESFESWLDGPGEHSFQHWLAELVADKLATRYNSSTEAPEDEEPEKPKKSHGQGLMWHLSFVPAVLISNILLQ
jgi:glycosyltransferase involved in cell wall biosynthesis